MRVSLLDFHNRKCRYELETTTGEVSHRECESETEAETGTRGMATFVKVGLRNRRSAFFAFYVDEGSLQLAADGLFVDLGDSSVRVERVSVAPFVKRFSVYRDGNRSGSWLYWFTDLREDGFVPKDILSYIAREIAPPEELRGWILFWEESAAGRDPARPEFQEEMKRRLQSTE